MMDIHKANTTAYHPQTDGLVEQFNRTLLAMLSKIVESGGRDWDERLPFILFAYRASPQHSTGESPFFLLYGRDPQLPIDAALVTLPFRPAQHVDDYKTVMVQRMSDAWQRARNNVCKAQKKQKHNMTGMPDPLSLLLGIAYSC